MLQDNTESSSLSGTELRSTRAESSPIVTIDLTIGSDEMDISESNGTERRQQRAARPI